MSDTSDRKKLGAAWYVAFAVGLPIFYVLSSGPMVKYGLDTIGRENLRIVYAPLIWLHDRTPLGPLLEQYWQLWGVR